MDGTIEILSIPVDNVSMEEATEFVFNCIEEGKAASIATANAEMLMRAREDSELARILKDADMVVPDGAGVLWAAEQQGRKFKERVAGVDLAYAVMKNCVVKGTKIYFFGGAPGIAETAAANMRAQVGELNLLSMIFGIRERRFFLSLSACRSRKNGSAGTCMNWVPVSAWALAVHLTYWRERSAVHPNGCGEIVSNGSTASAKSRAGHGVCWLCLSL